MKKQAIWAGLAGLSAFVWAGPAVNLLLEDRVLGYVDVPNVPALKAKAETAPFAKMWQDEKLQKFIAPALARLDIPKLEERLKERTGQGLAAWAGMLKGEVLLAMVAPAQGQPDVVLLLDVGDNDAKIPELLSKAFTPDETEKRKLEMEEEEVGGVTLHEYIVVTPPAEGADGEPSRESSFWFAKEGVFVLSGNRDVAVEIAGALTRGSAVSPLGRSENFLRELAAAGSDSVRVVVDFNRVEPVLTAYATAAQAGKPTPPAMAPDAIINSLGIRELNTLSFSLRFEEQAMTTRFSLDWREEKGLLRLLAFKPGPVVLPAFVPQRWVAVTAAKYSLPDVFTAIKESVRAHDQNAAAMLTGAIASANLKMGFDIERDLFGSLGDDVLVARAPRPGIPLEKLTAFDIDEFIAITLTNPKAITTVLDSVLQQIDPQNRGAVLRREYLGANIATLPIAPDELSRPRSVSVCVWRNQLFLSIGTPAAVEAAIKTGTEGESTLWQKPEVKAAFDRIPSQSVAFSFQDNRAAIAMILGTFVKMVESAPVKEGEQPLLDVSSQPSVEDLAKYWDYSYSYATKDGQSFKTISILPYLP